MAIYLIIGGFVMLVLSGFAYLIEGANRDLKKF